MDSLIRLRLASDIRQICEKYNIENFIGFAKAKDDSNAINLQINATSEFLGSLQVFLPYVIP